MSENIVLLSFSSQLSARRKAGRFRHCQFVRQAQVLSAQMSDSPP